MSIRLDFLFDVFFIVFLFIKITVNFFHGVLCDDINF